MNDSLREEFERILSAGLAAVDPAEAVRRHVSRLGNELVVAGQSYDLGRFRRVFVFGAGKAGAPMAGALEEILAGRLTGGLISVKYGHGIRLEKVTVLEAGHPVPDEAGLGASQTMLENIENCTSDDLVFFVFSGGGSALLPSLRPPLKLAEKQATTRLLLECGASIEEINSLRKHLSRSKGGALARAAGAATVISLILSDVVGDSLDVIASGPTVPDPTTFSDCLVLLERYGLVDRVPGAVLDLILNGASGLEPETPKPGEPAFRRVRNLVVGNNLLALSAAKEEAERLGYAVMILSSRIRGEAREVARVMAAIGKEIAESGNPVPPPACVLAGGETTVTISGSGKGGRNQELVLAAAIDLRGYDNVAIMSAGTDGTDGPTDAAGAVADGSTFQKARAAGMEPLVFLARNDSYNFFNPLDLLIKTGPTRTNVMDLICLIVGRG